MKKEYISHASIFIMIIFNNYIIYKYYLIPSIYNKVGNMSFFYIIIMFIISLLFLVLLKNKKLNSISKRFNNRFYKTCFSIYLIINSLITLLMSTRVLNNLFFYDYSYIFIIIPILIVSILLSKIQPKGVINIFLLPALLYFLLFIIYNFINISIKDLKLLLPVRFENLNNFGIIFLSIILLFDNYIFFLLREDFKKDLKNKYIFFSNLVWLFLLLIECINITLLAGNEYLRDYEFISFIIYNIQTTYKYFGGLDFIHIFLITFFSTFKIGLNISISKKFITNKVLYLILIPLFLFVILIYNNYSIMYNYLKYIIMGAFLLFIPYIIYLFKGEKHV